MTSGAWEVRGVERRGDLLFLTGTKDSHTQLHLYRCGLDGSDLKRLTQPGGRHRTSVSPDGKFFLDSWSNPTSPQKAALFDADGKRVRTLDTNPAYELEQWELGTFERVQITSRDGFVMEGSILKPPGFDKNKKYPVWFITYAGPHAPTIAPCPARIGASFSRIPHPGQ